MPERCCVAVAAASDATRRRRAVRAHHFALERRLSQQEEAVPDPGFKEHAEAVLHNTVGALLFGPKEQQDPVALRQHGYAHDCGLPNDDTAAGDEPLQHFLDREQVVRGQSPSIGSGLRAQDFAEDDDRRPVHHALVRWHDVDDGACRGRGEQSHH